MASLIYKYNQQCTECSETCLISPVFDYAFLEKGQFSQESYIYIYFVFNEPLLLSTATLQLTGGFVYSSDRYNHIKLHRSLTSSPWQRWLHTLNVKKRDDGAVMTTPRNFYWWQRHCWITTLTGTSDLMDDGGPHSEKLFSFFLFKHPLRQLYYQTKCYKECISLGPSCMELILL